MSEGQSKTPARVQARPEQDGSLATAAGICNVAQKQGCIKRAGLFKLYPNNGGEPIALKVKGREAWALERLIEAGPKGCTPLNEPAPRWSAYVHKLRERGVPIETVTEAHGGAYAGTHGRYVLRARVSKGGDTC